MSCIVNNLVQVNEHGMSAVGASEPDIVLTATPMRLLSYLLSHPNRVISRDELFNHVWEEKGLTPSGASLSQYLSVLRRNFQRYGFDEKVIENIPKEGVRFNAQVILIEDDKNNNVIYILNDALKKIKRSKKKLAALIIFMFLPSFYFLFNAIDFYPASQHAKWDYIEDYSGCNIYLPAGEKDSKMKKIYVTRVQMLLKNIKVKCFHEDKILIYIQNPLNNFNESPSRQREFFAHCRKIKVSYYCHSYYYFHGNKQ